MSAIKDGIAHLVPQPALTTRGTPRKRPYNRLSGWTLEQKKARHKAQMREYQRNKMSLSLDTANRVINEQEDSIKELENKVLDREDQRDGLQDKLIELQKAMRRIECAEDLEVCHRIARDATKVGV